MAVIEYKKQADFNSNIREEGNYFEILKHELYNYSKITPYDLKDVNITSEFLCLSDDGEWFVSMYVDCYGREFDYETGGNYTRNDFVFEIDLAFKREYDEGERKYKSKIVAWTFLQDQE